MDRKVVERSWIEICKRFLRTADLMNCGIKLGFEVKGSYLFVLNEETGEREPLAMYDSNTQAFSQLGLASEFVESLCDEVLNEVGRENFNFEEHSHLFELKAKYYINTIGLKNLF